MMIVTGTNRSKDAFFALLTAAALSAGAAPLACSSSSGGGGSGSSSGTASSSGASSSSGSGSSGGGGDASSASSSGSGSGSSSGAGSSSGSGSTSSSGGTSSGYGGCPTTALQVLDYLGGCSVSVNGATGETLASKYFCVDGTVTLAATPTSGHSLPATPWHGTDGDTGSGDPGMVSGNTDSTTVTVPGNGNTQCVWVCCETTGASDCPAANQCP